MTHTDKLTYCKYCLNSTFDTNKGLICRLTTDKPNFKSVCQHFNKDMEELIKSRKGSGAYRISSDESTNYIFPYLSEKDKKTIHLNSLSLFKKVFKSWEFYTLSIVIVFGFPLLSSKLNIPLEYSLIIGTLLFVAVLLFLFKSFRKKPYLVIDKLGLELH